MASTGAPPSTCPKLTISTSESNSEVYLSELGIEPEDMANALTFLVENVEILELELLPANVITSFSTTAGPSPKTGAEEKPEFLLSRWNITPEKLLNACEALKKASEELSHRVTVDEKELTRLRAIKWRAESEVKEEMREVERRIVFRTKYWEAVEQLREHTKMIYKVGWQMSGDCSGKWKQIDIENMGVE